MFEKIKQKCINLGLDMKFVHVRKRKEKERKRKKKKKTKTLILEIKKTHLGTAVALRANIGTSVKLLLNVDNFEQLCLFPNTKAKGNNKSSEYFLLMHNTL